MSSPHGSPILVRRRPKSDCWESHTRDEVQRVGWGVGLKWRPASAALRRVLLCSLLRAVCRESLSACLRLCLALAFLHLCLRLHLRTCVCTVRVSATAAARTLRCLFLRVHLRPCVCASAFVFLCPRVDSGEFVCVHVYACERLLRVCVGETRTRTFLSPTADSPLSIPSSLPRVHTTQYLSLSVIGSAFGWIGSQAPGCQGVFVPSARVV